MLWREARQRKGEREGSKSEAEVLHAVTHGGGWGDPFGFHYTSVDGGFTWVAHSRAKVYQNVVEMGGPRGDCAVTFRVYYRNCTTMRHM